MKRALEGLEGVTSVRVELDTGRAVIDYREGTATDAQVIAAVQDTVVVPGLRRWLARLSGKQRSSANR